MHKNNIAFGFTKFFAFLVIIAAYAVIVGWFFDIQVLKSIHPDWPVMKFPLSIAFFCAGIILFSIAANAQKQGVSTVAEIMMPTSILVIMLIVSELLITVIFGVRTGLDELFTRPEPQELLNAVRQFPAMGDMLCLIFIAIAGVDAMVLTRGDRFRFFLVGLLVTVLGSVGIAGYVLEQPKLYFSFEEWSSPMAFHCAALFACIGLGLMMVSIGIGIQLRAEKAKEAVEDEDEDEEDDSGTEDKEPEPKPKKKSTPKKSPPKGGGIKIKLPSSSS